MKQIQIRCKGTSALPLDSFQNLQGNLKELRESEYKKLRKSIEKYGFRFPIFVWGNFILDGHQRILVIQKMISEGWSIDPIPVVEIEAENEKEAKRLVLLITSRYGHVTDEGLYEFIMTSELDFNELKEEVDLPEIDFKQFEENFLKEAEIKTENETYTLMFKFLKDDAAYVQETLHREREKNKESLDYHWRERCLLRLLRKTD